MSTQNSVWLAMWSSTEPPDRAALTSQPQSAVSGAAQQPSDIQARRGVIDAALLEGGGVSPGTGAQPPPRVIPTRQVARLPPVILSCDSDEVLGGVHTDARYISTRLNMNSTTL